VSIGCRPGVGPGCITPPNKRGETGGRVLYNVTRSARAFSPAVVDLEFSGPPGAAHKFPTGVKRLERRTSLDRGATDMQIYRDKDLKVNVWRDARVAVLGYGNQGHAHAMNLRDSGAGVVVGARPDGEGWRRARAEGFTCLPVAEAVDKADCIAVLLPDEVQDRVFREEIAPNLAAGATLVFAHGFGVAFGAVAVPEGHDVVLVAPKGQGHYLRKQYTEGKGLPCLLAVEVDASGEGLERALSYAQMLGCLGAGAIETTFREEAITDLFGEQAVLCGGVPALVVAAYETLVGAGYRPEVAYIECLHELKIITDLMHRGGISYMRRRISHTAAWGSFQTGPKVVTDDTRQRLREVLTSIENGEFADGWSAETAQGQKHLKENIDSESAHDIETAGRAVRGLMPYLEEDDH
jgi:ketol-acid reductoisomerase